jgi:Flp pilus assembly protein TadD
MNKNLANYLALLSKEKISEASTLLRSTVGALEPWEKMFALGARLHKLGDLGAAESFYRRSCAEDNAEAVVFANLGKVLIGTGRYREAAEFLERAFKDMPTDHKVIGDLLTSLLDGNRHDRALEIISTLPQKLRFDRFVRLGESAALRASGKREQAMALLEKLIQQYPTDALVHRMLGDTIGEISSELSLEHYDLALKYASSSRNKGALFTTQWNMSLHLLRLRDFARGWQFYEAGLTREVGTMGRKLPPNLYSVKRADTLEKFVDDKWTIVLVEQGIGDQILFLSALQDALDEFKRIILLCEPRLAPIVKRSFPNVVIGMPGLIEFIGSNGFVADGFVPLGSFMRRYRPTVDTFVANRRGFLVVDQKRYKSYRTKLLERARGRPIVGISWKGGFWENQQRNKAIEIEHWEPVFKRNAMVVNLQYGDVSQESEWARARGHELFSIDGIDFKENLDEWLTLAAACDGIVSVSTALVHFAGACGQKVGVVMPERQGPWIWGVNDKRSIVYPNVYLYRMQAGESRRDLIERVANVIS